MFVVTSGFSQVKNITVFDSKTNQVIPFVNVVIKNTNIGWSGNENGVVKLNFTKIYLSDSLIFSAVGYEKITINYALINSISQIKLTTSSVYLNEVKIKAKRYRRARLGRKKSDKYSERGNGLTRKKLANYTAKEAKYIPNDIGADGIIRELRIYIRFGSEYPFEVDVLNVSKIDGSPTHSLLKNPIECIAKKDEKWITINVKEYNIHIPENGFFVAINWNLDSAMNSEEKQHSYKTYYINEKKPRIDTFFYRGTIIGFSYDKEPNWWVNNDSTWRNYWQSTINFQDTCVQCLVKYPDYKKHDFRTINKSTLAIYANILYSKSEKKYEENILDKEGIVSRKDKKEILSKTYQYHEKQNYLYPQRDVFQLFESIKRAVDSNNMNYIAHHFLSYTYESIDGFDLELNKKRREQIINDINEILKDRKKVKLTKEGNGFYTFYFSEKIGGRLLLRNGEWTMMVEMETRRT